jgi:hypothetical protein
MSMPANSALMSTPPARALRMRRGKANVDDSTHMAAPRYGHPWLRTALALLAASGEWIVFVSGQIAVRPGSAPTDIVGTTNTEQTRQAIRNVKAILGKWQFPRPRSQGYCALPLALTIQGMNEAYAEFPGPKPAQRSRLGVDIPVCSSLLRQLPPSKRPGLETESSNSAVSGCYTQQRTCLQRVSPRTLAPCQRYQC